MKIRIQSDTLPFYVLGVASLLLAIALVISLVY